MLARVERLDGQLGMGVVRRGDDDDVDVITRDHASTLDVARSKPWRSARWRALRPEAEATKTRRSKPASFKGRDEGHAGEVSGAEQTDAVPRRRGGAPARRPGASARSPFG